LIDRTFAEMANKVLYVTQKDSFRFVGIWILWILNGPRFRGVDQICLEGNQARPFLSNFCFLFLQLRPKQIRRGKE
jgi:hypothetical protein